MKFYVPLGLLILLILYLEPSEADTPLWLDLIGWYIGVAIWVSLKLPKYTGSLRGPRVEVSAKKRVLVGLVWPVYVTHCIVHHGQA